jgi:adenosylcobinamide kinase / adenosylcobinamide-phosphate guanylyltransferase
VKGLSLIGGGARSGKSALALSLALRQNQRRVFIATSEPFDQEMRDRAHAHRAERGAAFDTIEAPRDADAVVEELCREPSGTSVIVIDCLTLWLSNLLLAEVPSSEIRRRVRALSILLVEAPFPTFVVTNEVGMGLVPETPIGRAFRDLTGHAHQDLASRATSLYFATLGTILRLKPAPVAVIGTGADR